MGSSHIFLLAFMWCFAEVRVWGFPSNSSRLLTERPHWLIACRRNDPNLNKCLNDLFVNMFPELAKGIPELDVPQFEPLHLDRVSVSKGAGPIVLSGSLYNMAVAGPSNATPAYTEFNETGKTWAFGLDIPRLLIRAQYNLKGKILILPLVGHGGCDLKLTDVVTVVRTNVSYPIVEDRELVRIETMHVKFSVGGMRVKLSNLFNGNKALGHTLNNFINQHAVDVVSELEEDIGESLAEIFTDIMNRIYGKLPTDLWLLSDDEYEKYQKEKGVTLISTENTTNS